MEPRLIFMGTPDFAVPALQKLAEHYPLAAVITQPDRPAGRGRKLSQSAVKKTALDLDLNIFQPEDVNTPASIQKIRTWSPDLIIVAAFGQILKPDLLAVPSHGCLNIHASLLPRWRGASPINAAILNGDPESGVTIIKMTPGLDSGPILAQKRIPVGPDETAGSLFDTLAQAGAELIVETIPDYLAGRITPREQDESQSTYAPLLSRKDGRLDFSLPAYQLARKVRAFHPWPGTYANWKGDRLLIHRAHSADVTSPGPGVLTIHEGLPAVGTSHGLLVLDDLQPAGRRRMSGKAFLNGSPDWNHSQIDR